MEFKNIKVSIQTLIAACTLLLAGSGAYYTLASDVKSNATEIDRVKQRTFADSNRIRRIETKAAVAEAERQIIKETAKENGKKLDAILRQLRSPLPSDPQ